MKLVTKKVYGNIVIPKINELPPKIIRDTESFFEQLRIMGFTVVDYEQEETTENTEVETESKTDLSLPEGTNVTIETSEELTEALTLKEESTLTFTEEVHEVNEIQEEVEEEEVEEVEEIKEEVPEVKKEVKATSSKKTKNTQKSKKNKK